MSGFLGELLSGQARKEMRQRTDTILSMQQQLRDAITSNTRILKKLAASGIDSALRQEFVMNWSAVITAEKELMKAISEHVVFMEKILNEAKD